MKHTLFLFFTLCIFSGAACQNQKTVASSQIVDSKPNILYILVDDFGWRDIAGTGSDFYETPNMDKLLKEGMKFNQAYSSYPRCVPSRYSILTGNHPARVSTGGGESGFKLKPTSTNMGRSMNENGYHSFYVGKWHLGELTPQEVGFDESIAAGKAGATSSHFAPFNVKKNGKPGKEAKILDLDDAEAGDNLEDRLTEEAIKLITKNANKPFFGVLAHYAVHTPIQGKQEYIKYFRQKLRKNPADITNEYEPESAGENKLVQDHPVYAAMIKAVDDGVGEILNSLEKLGIADNTVIILTSDHGGLSSRGNNREVATTNRPLRAGKGHIYEGGIRVPMFVKWPNVVEAGSESNSPIFGTDHFKTILEIAHANIPKDFLPDSKSYVSVLQGQEADKNRTMYWHNPSPRPRSTADLYSSAIRQGDYKLLDFYAEDRLELYNLKLDEGERENIAEENPELTQKMYKQLNSWRKEVNASMKIKENGLRDSTPKKKGGGKKQKTRP